MKRFFLCMFILTSSCVFDQQIIYRSGVRRVAGARLDSCLRSPPGRPWNEKACLEEQHQYCLARGLEANCGVDELWGRFP